MPLSKHDSMVVTEIISAFGVLSILGVVIFLSLIFGEIRTANNLAEKSLKLEYSQEKSQEQKKITMEDLDEDVINSIGQGLSQLNNAQQASNEEISFYMNKILEKNYSKTEIEKLVAEFVALQKAKQEKAAPESTEKPAE